MGGKVERYINTPEDLLEKPVKKGKNLHEVYKITNTNNIEEICSIVLEPNKWNVIHLVCWYNNATLLREIIESPNFDRKYIDMPDVNLEPPIAICCIVDALDCLQILIENGAVKTFESNSKKYRKDLNLNKLCVYHDASKCFGYLNPDLTIESTELDDLYDLSKKNGSDRIAAMFDDFQAYKGLDSVIEVQEEGTMEQINF